MSTKTAVSARPSLVARLRLSEPVRLYSYGVLSAVLVVLVVVGAITEEWQAALTGMAAAILGVAPAAELTRPSVYSEAGHFSALYNAGARIQARQESSRAA